MTDSEKSIILKLVNGDIEQAHYLKDINILPEKIDEYVLNLMHIAYQEKNSEDLEYAFLVAFVFDVPRKFHKILCVLILENWHTQHENIAMILQKIKSPQSINCIYDAIGLADTLEYLEYDDGEAFIVKCIWALGVIDTTYSNRKLKELVESNNEFVKVAALHQLERNGRDLL